MERKIVFLMLFFVVFSLVVVSGIGKQIDGNGKVNKDVVDKFVNSQTAEVFVKFKDKNELSEKSLTEVKDNIKSSGIENDFGDFISMEINSDDLIKLQNNPDVERISLVGIKHIMLQDSVSLINATLSHSITLNGVNLTGTGQTVCIVDTGVNYSHPDLGGCYGNNNASSNCKVLGGYDFVNNDNNPMDDYGHGTHVAGIIAANGTINGVAPGAKIVALKVCDSSGSCSDSDIINGINWCVGNSSVYNISVISISLGGVVNYTSYCDNDVRENSNLFASPINSATAKNISVVIATGNAANKTGISSPACIENVTAVGSATKADAISSFSNRNSLVKLFAPGGDLTTAGGINSTYLSASGYASLSGTSMATPHVAAAIAIINQFLRLSGQQRTPKQIEAVLNNTGKIINDSTGINYTRINVYSALISLGAGAPVVNLITPTNNLFTNSNQTFRCNASTNNNLINLTFYLWNSTSSVINISNISITGLSNSSNFSINFTYEDNYAWNCLFEDNLNRISFATSNFSLRYDVTYPNLNIISPINGSWSNAGRFNSTLNENGSCFYSLDYGINNITINSTDNQNFTSINNTLVQGVYNVSFYCNDSAGNANSTIRTFNIDLTSPNVTLLSPDSGFSVADNVNINFIYNVSDNLNISSCSLIVDNSVSLTNSSIVNLTVNQSITKTLASGSHSWGINCTDIAGNIGNSSSRSITITSTAVVVQNNNGGGGGGGGGGTPSGTNNVLTSQQAEQGVSRELAIKDKVTFEIASEKHSVTLNNMTDSTANITISSNPINLLLGVGQSVRLNLTSSDYYNLFVKLEGIKEKEANLTVKVINELIVNIIPKEKNDTTQVTATPTEPTKRDNTFYYIIGILVIVVIIFLAINYVRKLRTRKEPQRKHRR